MPPSTGAEMPEHELGRPGPSALTEESTVTTNCWPGEIRSVFGWKAPLSRTAKMIGPPPMAGGELACADGEVGVGDDVRVGDGLADPVADGEMVVPDPTPADAPECPALPQAHSAPVSANPASATLS
jgi:hypothetical protein